MGETFPSESSFFSKATFKPYEIYIPTDGDNPNDFFFAASYLMSVMWYPAEHEIEFRKFCTAYSYISWLARYNKHINKPNVDLGPIELLLITPPTPRYDPWFFASESITAGLIISYYHTSYLMNHKEPSLKKSINAVYKSYEKLNMPSSVDCQKQISMDKIKERWETYKPVSHLISAAFDVYTKRQQEINNHLQQHLSWFSVLFTPKYFFEVLAVAETIRSFATAHCPPRTNKRYIGPVFPSGETWCPPQKWEFEPVNINCEKNYADINKWLTSRIKK